MATPASAKATCPACSSSVLLKDGVPDRRRVKCPECDYEFRVGPASSSSIPATGAKSKRDTHSAMSIDTSEMPRAKRAAAARGRSNPLDEIPESVVTVGTVLGLVFGVVVALSIVHRQFSSVAGSGAAPMATSEGQGGQAALFRR